MGYDYKKEDKRVRKKKDIPLNFYVVYFLYIVKHESSTVIRDAHV